MENKTSEDKIYKEIILRGCIGNIIITSIAFLGFLLALYIWKIEITKMINNIDCRIDKLIMTLPFYIFFGMGLYYTIKSIIDYKKIGDN